MEMLAAFGGGLFVLASLVVGGRLILMSFSTKGLPEFLLGSGLFWMGGVGYPLMAIAVNATGLGDGTRIAMGFGNMACQSLGMLGVAWFTRSVFRPHESLALGLMVGIGVAYGALAALQLTGPGMLAYLQEPETGAWANSMFVGLVVMIWAGVESLRYYRMQRRRLALGLADPVVTDRFRLWAVAILVAAFISGLTAVLRMFGIETAGTALGSAIVGTFGLVSAGSLWLAFWPPERYLARVKTRSAGA